MMASTEKHVMPCGEKTLSDRNFMVRREMYKTIILWAISVFLCSCSTLRYGYLPGTDYKLLEPTKSIDLKGKVFDIDFRDNRKNKETISCSMVGLDRDTELEGELGMRYLRESIVTMIQNSNGRIDPHAPGKLTIDLDGLSFRLIGTGYIVAHGLVQFKVSSPTLNKIYCSDMTDHDEDSPLSWYSVTTRKSGSRLMVSGSVRRAVESFVNDLANMGNVEPDKSTQAQ
jgi:hypothetical protein